jgi:hypothetical protein
LLEGRATTRTIDKILVRSTGSAGIQRDMLREAYSEALEHNR